jgi:hypothetical protein
LPTKFRLAYPTSVPSLDLLFLFYQEKRKSPLGGDEPRQDSAKEKNSERIKIASCLAMTAVLKIQIFGYLFIKKPAKQA